MGDTRAPHRYDTNTARSRLRPLTGVMPFWSKMIRRKFLSVAPMAGSWTVEFWPIGTSLYLNSPVVGVWSAPAKGSTMGLIQPAL